MDKLVSVWLVLIITFLPCNSQDNKKKVSQESAQKSVQFSSHDLFISGENNVNEYRIPSIVTTNNGNLIAVCWARNDKIDLVMKKSSFRGKTWSEASNDSTLIEPGCQGSLINYKYNNISLLIFSNPADKKERKNMVVRVSIKEGKSWQKELPIYSGSAGYSCITQIPNGNVGLLYEADNSRRIVFVEIPYQELF